MHLVRLRILLNSLTIRVLFPKGQSNGQFICESHPEDKLILWKEKVCTVYPLILQGDVGLPGPAGPPPSSGELEFMGFPKGKKGSKVLNIYNKKK
jgi:hypothetical protein